MVEAKPISGFEKLYYVYTNGQIYSTVRKRILRPNKIRNGYYQYALYKNGKRHMRLGHKLVAEAFLPNPNNYPIINHKDENKTNNAVNNLEWCTHSYNVKYSAYKSTEHYKKLATLHKNQLSKRVVQIDSQGSLVRSYESITEAAEQTGINRGNIASVCCGNRKTAGGYIWKYKED